VSKPEPLEWSDLTILVIIVAVSTLSVTLGWWLSRFVTLETPWILFGWALMGSLIFGFFIPGLGIGLIVNRLVNWLGMGGEDNDR